MPPGGIRTHDRSRRAAVDLRHGIKKLMYKNTTKYMSEISGKITLSKGILTFRTNQSVTDVKMEINLQ